MSKKKEPTVFTQVWPHTLGRVHIFQGEEVVTGGDDGQVWVATFASAHDAEAFIAAARFLQRKVRGIRRKMKVRRTADRESA